MKLSECPARSSNLQLLRFLAAVIVILSHAFTLSTGSVQGEWLMQFTFSQLTLGELAVSIFFCAGGYLIARSMERTANGLLYFKTRILRIIPLLAVVVLLSALILGPLMTQYTLREYFTDSQLYRYLLNAFLILQHDLPGVFLHNPHAPTVNGSLWTLPVEFLCYIGCYLMWKLRFFQIKYAKYSILFVAAGMSFLAFFANYTGLEILLSMIRPVLLFYIGILFFIYRERIRFTPTRLLLCLVLFAVTVCLHVINMGMILFFPYILLYLCFAITQIPEKIGSWGNASYGIYLCAFPIQQTLVALSGGNMNPLLNMLYAVPLSILIGYLLYHFVEKPITQWGKRFL